MSRRVQSGFAVPQKWCSLVSSSHGETLARFEAEKTMKKPDCVTRTSCKVCGSEIVPYFDLGDMPLPDDFQSAPGNDVRRFKLELAYCKGCHLSQLTVDVNPDLMFRDFPWESSVSKPNLEHFQELASIASERLGMKRGDVVVDIACNDGGPLDQFSPYEVVKVGVDPATNLIELAKTKGISTINEYWTPAIADGIVSSFGKAKIVTATQVFGHVANIREFVAGLKVVLAEDGTCIVEAPHHVDLINGTLFDTVHHEHPSYWLLHSADTLFRKHGMMVYDVEKTSVYGGSLRMFVGHEGKHEIKPSVAKMIASEEEGGFYSFERYQGFGTQAANFRANVRRFLTQLKADGERLVGFGAGAKGCIALNYCGLDSSFLDHVIDETEGKQGMYIPGVDLKVVGMDELDANDVVFILSWNFSEAIIERSKIAKGHVVPLPELVMHRTRRSA